MDNLVLVGFSLSGKTTVGRMLARHLRLQFVDTDKVIEQTTGRTIPDIFRVEGEAAFRKLERETVAQVCTRRFQVISTGGGAFVDAQNRDALRHGNLVIHLRIQPRTVLKRLHTSRSGRARPLLDHPDPLKHIHKLMNARHHAYSLAHITIDVDSSSAYDLTTTIARRWFDWRRLRRGAERHREQRALDGEPTSDSLESTPADASIALASTGVIESSIHTTLLRAGGRDVPLLAGPGALAELPSTLRRQGFQGQLVVVADERAVALHGEALEPVFTDVPRLLISGDESAKTLDQVSRVWDWLLEQRVQRRDAVVAFGGGVVCDLVGFAAACHLRGVALVNVPTTLLAQVDASVGGKTGVNHARGKNLIGAFHQPLAVVADTLLLNTLSPRAFAAGMAEVAKIAMIRDAALFERLEHEAAALTPSTAVALTPFVARAIELKAEIVERDEREDGERMLLNYGHTVGHALEAAAGYGTLLHGEAVAIGMEAAAYIAGHLGMLTTEDARRQRDLTRALGLPTSFSGPMSVDEVLGRLSLDKKRAGSRQRWVLAERIGQARVRADVPDEMVREAVERIFDTGF